MDNEEQDQEVAILDVLRPMLKLCGYNCESKSDPDFQFIHNRPPLSDKENFIICGEGKQVKNLPQKLVVGLRAHLCRYGFEMRIARNTYTSMKDVRFTLKRLLNLLDIKDGNTVTSAKLEHIFSMSDMVIQILTFSDTNLDNEIDIRRYDIRRYDNIDDGNIGIKKEMTESSKKVVSINFEEGKIKSKDASHLWGATIQACEASVKNKIKFTVVMSARVMWFVKLEVKHSDQCTILISDGVLIGETGFTQKLIRFVRLADDTDKISNGDNNIWRKNLSLNKSNDSEENGNSHTNGASMGSSNGPKPESESTNKGEGEGDNSNTNIGEPSGLGNDSGNTNIERDNEDESADEQEQEQEQHNSNTNMGERSGSEHDYGGANYKTDNKRKRNYGNGHKSLMSSKEAIQYSPNSEYG